jgi:hypothetical protein
MHELRQFIIYACGAAFVAAVMFAGTSYAVIEGVRYLPYEPPIASSVSKHVELANAEAPRDHDARPVWIAETPKYDYDPRLMLVKPRAERLKEAELKRKQETAKYLAKQHAEKARVRSKVAREHRERRLREAANAYAYQPEQRPAFGIFPLFQ